MQAYSGMLGIIQAYSEPSETLTYSEPEAYAEPWHIQNPSIFNLVKHLRWSVLQKLLATIVLLQYQLFMFSIFLKWKTIFFSQSIYSMKKVKWSSGPGTENFDIPMLYLKIIQKKKQDISNNMPCCHFLLMDMFINIRLIFEVLCKLTLS